MTNQNGSNKIEDEKGECSLPSSWIELISLGRLKYIDCQQMEMNYQPKSINGNHQTLSVFKIFILLYTYVFKFSITSELQNPNYYRYIIEKPTNSIYTAYNKMLNILPISLSLSLPPNLKSFICTIFKCARYSREFRFLINHDILWNKTKYLILKQK